MIFKLKSTDSEGPTNKKKLTKFQDLVDLVSYFLKEIPPGNFY